MTNPDTLEKQALAFPTIDDGVKSATSTSKWPTCSGRSISIAAYWDLR